MTGLIHVITSCDTAQAAEKLAAHIIDARLAACAQIEPITSYYMWDGARQISEEFRIVFKTLAHLRPDIETAIKAAHSYDLPQIIFAEIEASADYSNWVKSNVKARLRP
jgi:periplasmic divalent cation tolerance protein